MDQHIAHAIERSLAHSGCPLCGARLRLMRVLSQRDVTAVFSAHCDECGADSTRLCFTGDALVQIQQRLIANDEEACVSPPTRYPGPLTTRDVACVREFLATFDGDFLRLFQRLSIPRE